MRGSRRLQMVLMSIALLTGTGSALALNTATIVASALSPDCLGYRVVGVCYWLFCTSFGCTVRTTIKVRHYVPDAVVSSYSNTGENPWTEVRAMSLPNPTARAGGDGTANQDHENNLSKFKNADVIGHPAGAAFSEFASQSGYTCEGAGKPFAPYLLSTIDTLAWRYNVPEMAYPEALTPGVREIGSRLTADLWGNVYPRGGFLHQSDDYLAGAVVAQRAGDVFTRTGQPHVYQPLLATPHAGYWPAGALVESHADLGKWQELTLSSHCAVFPNKNTHAQAQQGDYAWALWRPYSCCQRRGQVFLGSMDFL
ncbi:TIGR03756 family integrating conjugative element protein [Xanthomonas axonopodis pv. vasculorum]|uniref:Conjugal transfer protein n=2 Tax=Xanthomonas axonopodis TaxID=53413 RepID=A0A098PZW8_9XANT|nr:TIGR03756 family integrating conjugative element protein [Xanthomonas axonopodis]KGE52281.1 conjugal transfer protein [Xanthomonas axonopodis pv. vasculorum]PPV09785.1 TIGR03756 family integrating conjugative element protein [Xanthomonas axonopodis pv. vasculorum]QKD86766.1 TIGR03756 family integrating conjugative element protein [Xanthomonas axonopodis pv. vasculorum]